MVDIGGCVLSRSEITDSLVSLGVREGEVLYLRAGLKAFGGIDGSISDTIIGGIMDALGGAGTLIVPAFIKPYRIWQRNIPVVDETTAPYTGGLSKSILSHVGVYRSSHPTHSFAAIGKMAKDILMDHDHKSSCFAPMKKVIELQGRMMLIGCVDSSPGFSTVHFAQYELGLSKRHYNKLFNHVKIRIGGSETFFRSDESPGCSDAFSNFYREYIVTENIKVGHIGKAWAICVKANEAYEVEKEILRINPRYVICEDPCCISCRVLRGYNKRAIPAASIRIVMNKIFQLLGRSG